MLRVLRFASLFLVALTLGLAFCHVMEVPGKLRLSGPEWLTVQHNLYVAFGPALGAWIEVGGIVLTWAVIFLARRRRGGRWTLAAAVCTTAGLGVWFVMVAPVNAALNGWTPDTLPADWTAYRNRWEAGHAVHAALFALGFGALVAAILAETPE
jgi:hypothetical protein